MMQKKDIIDGRFELKLKTSLIFLFLIISGTNNLTYSQSGWYPLSSNTTYNIVDIQFLDNNTGYFIANDIFTSYSIVKKTINGGSSWSPILTIPYLNRLFFINQNTGTVVGALGTIRRTTDGGSTWITQTSPAGSNALLGVKFINSNTGFIAGDFRTTLFTTDGGTNWVNRSFGSSKALWSDVYFFNENTGFVTGFTPAGQTIIKTTDAGFTWNYVQGLTGGFYRISFANTLTGFCAGTSGIVKSTDSGNNWFNTNFTGNYNFRGLSIIDSNNLVVVGDGGKIFRTNNSGLNWLQQTSGTTKRLYGTFFINSNTGWVTGDTGTLLKTTNGGITAIQPTSNDIPEHYTLSQNYPNPFNPSTHINYELPSSNFVLLKVYNVNGKEIETLVNEKQSAGSYSITFNAVNYPSGVYFYRLKSGSFTESKRMILVK